MLFLDSLVFDVMIPYGEEALHPLVAMTFSSAGHQFVQDLTKNLNQLYRF
jgi:hypothetical protein